MATLTLIKDPETPNLTRSISKTVTIKGSHTLEIRGFSLTKGMGVGKCISSDTFLVGGHLWKVEFYPDGKEKDVSGDIYVSFFITMVSRSEEDVRAWFEYVLLDESGNKWYRTRSCFKRMKKGRRWMAGPYALNDGSRTIGYEPFYKRTDLEESGFIKDDCLTIQCTVGVLKTSMDGPKTSAQPLPLSDLGQSYGQLLNSKEGSDVSFKVEGEIFYAHKLILSTRSPVFKAQFFGPLKEENTQCIKIEDMHAPVFKALLHFIYCDVIPDVGEELQGLDSKWVATMMTHPLLAAADRYGIERLRSLCEARLSENIATDTVATSLALAEQHGCFQLKSTCLEFIGLPENLEVVMQTDGFKNLKENYPAVIDELLKSVARVRDFSSVSYRDTFLVGGHLWEIRFCPGGHRRVDESGEVYVSLYIALVSKCEGGVEAYMEYVLLDPSGNKWHVNNKNLMIGPYMGGPYSLNDKSSMWGHASFCKRAELETSQFIKDDCLSIQCTVGVVKTSIPLPLSDLGQIYGQLLKRKEESDVSFEVEGEVFYAHKLILSTRSPVFKAQFFGPLKEENTSGIKIEEMQAPVFKALLHFIYCDVIPDVGEELAVLEATMMTQHLLSAADRYGIDRLKSLCELRLCENLAIDTVASSLALAEQHSCFQLKSTCLEFIGLPENLEGVMQTDGFKNLKENYPVVIDELLKSIARVRNYTYVTYGPENRM
ncbi:hypothetical protein RD792_017257 [Penstemon davidsonii]|uniref:Uncharacterized protein n=1 Tax=Penstemon davidsonii TaxID=160366 RepID=A0ABR0CM94_9LAMI|nr:hypothetical protein RD792_017257 [Penstemon davidsonii]